MVATQPKLLERVDAVLELVSPVGAGGAHDTRLLFGLVFDGVLAHEWSAPCRSHRQHPAVNLGHAQGGAGAGHIARQRDHLVQPSSYRCDGALVRAPVFK
ncbi:MAG: hypothetical protein ACPIOQ_25150, partial [Promethearchaeia archaeon]